MDRPEITSGLSEMVEKYINPHRDPRIYWAKKVTFDYGKRVIELKDAAKPLVDYLYKYGTPHDAVIVRMDSVEHLSGETGSPIEVRD